MIINKTDSSTYVIKDRTISLPMTTKVFAVMGDNSSRVLTFRSSRRVDSVDLSQKEIWICFTNAYGDTGETAAENIRYSNSILEFDWAVPSEVTVLSGTIEFYVEFRETNEYDKEIYKLRTKPIIEDVIKSFHIDNSAEGYDYTLEKLFLDENKNYITRSDLVDTDIPFKVVDRDILMNPTKVIAVEKDNLSQMLSFRLKRHVDGVDRASKIFAFKFTNASGDTDMVPAANVVIHEHEIHIGWALDSKVTFKSGNVVFNIVALGFLENGDFHAWNTKTTQFTVENGMDVESSIEPPTASWIESWTIESGEVLKQSAQYTNQTKDLYNDMVNLDTILQGYVNIAKEQAILSREYSNKATEAVSEFDGLYAVRKEKDDDGIFKIVEYYRKDGSLYLQNTLSTSIPTGDNDRYDQSNEVRYDLDGSTVVHTRVTPIVYDSEDVVIGQIGTLNQLLYHGLM